MSRFCKIVCIKDVISDLDFDGDLMFIVKVVEDLKSYFVLFKIFSIGFLVFCLMMGFNFKEGYVFCIVV